MRIGKRTMRSRAFVLAATLCAVYAWGTTATAAPRAVTTVRVDTVLADAHPGPTTVHAAWTEDRTGNHLAIDGDNLPLATTTVTATWRSTRKGDRKGYFLGLDHTYTYAPVLPGASVDVVVELSTTGSKWVRIVKITRDYVGQAGPTQKDVAEGFRFRNALAANRTVGVRVTLTVRYAQATVGIDDRFDIAPT
jgi:hypothetical protein